MKKITAFEGHLRGRTVRAVNEEMGGNKWRWCWKMD